MVPSSFPSHHVDVMFLEDYLQKVYIANSLCKQNGTVQLVKFFADRFCWVRLTIHVVLCIFSKDSVEVVLSCERWSRPKLVLGRGSFDSQKLSFCANSNPPGPLPVTLPLALNISFCRKLPLSVRTQFSIKEVPSVTLKVAPLCSVVNTMVEG